MSNSCALKSQWLQDQEPITYRLVAPCLSGGASHERLVQRLLHQWWPFSWTKSMAGILGDPMIQVSAIPPSLFGGKKSAWRCMKSTKTPRFLSIPQQWNWRTTQSRSRPKCSKCYLPRSLKQCHLIAHPVDGHQIAEDNLLQESATSSEWLWKVYIIMM